MLKVEIWSDVVCPWCHVGKRRLESALARFAHAGEVDVVWRSFELDPSAPRRRPDSTVEHIAAKYGMSIEQAQANQARLTSVAAGDGLGFQLDRTIGGNTFDAHRLLHLAHARGLQDALKERLFRAYLSEGAAIGEPDVLRELAVEVGLDASEVDDLLAGSLYADEVRADERRAAALGISGVPFFVVDERYGISGAQPSELLLQALEQAWAESSPQLVGVVGGEGGACDGESCAV